VPWAFAEVHGKYALAFLVVFDASGSCWFWLKLLVHASAAGFGLSLLGKRLNGMEDACFDR